MEGLL